MTAAAKAQISVSIVVVSLGPREQLFDSLQQLRECNMLESSPGAATEVVVVDLGDEEGDEEALARAFPCVTVLREAPECGFASACNAGIAAARGTRILLLDPCTHIRGRFLPELVVYLDSHPSVGAVGPRLLSAESADASPPVSTDVDELARAEASPAMPVEPAGAQTLEAGETVDWLPATCLLLERRALNDVGPFHEGILFTFEEIDWCRRAREQGWEIHRLSSVVVELANDAVAMGEGAEAAVAQTHAGSFSQSRRRHFREHHGRAAAIAVDAVSGAKKLVKSAKAAIGLDR